MHKLVYLYNTGVRPLVEGSEGRRVYITVTVRSCGNLAPDHVHNSGQCNIVSVHEPARETARDQMHMQHWPLCLLSAIVFRPVADISAYYL